MTWSRDTATGRNDSLFSSSLYSEERKQGEEEVADQSQGQGQGQQVVVVDALRVSETCSSNSQLAKRCQDHQLAHLWHLLSVSLRIMSITKYVLQGKPTAGQATPAAPPSASASVSASATQDTHTAPPRSRPRRSSRLHQQHQHHHQQHQPQSHTSTLDSCRIMVTCGVSRDWTVHSLGRPLFSRVFAHLQRAGDLQTLATLICTVGGARVLALMLGDEALYTSCSLDKILLRCSAVVVL